MQHEINFIFIRKITEKNIHANLVKKGIIIHNRKTCNHTGASLIPKGRVYCYSRVAIDFNYCYSKVVKYDWTMTGHVTLPSEVYIFILDNAWGMFSWCSH